MAFSVLKIKGGTFRAPGTRVLHLAMPDYGAYITACPQTLDDDVKPGDTWLAEVHIQRRTVFAQKTSPDALSALDEGLQMLRADCVALIEEIDERFNS